MESVTILRALWRRRIEVCIVAVLAIFVGFSLAYHLSFPPQRRSYTVGVASAGVLVDTPRSQVIDVDPKGYDTLASRANVLANLMVDGAVKQAIAQRAGLTAKQITASSQSLGNDSPAPALNAHSNALRTSVALTSDMSLLPIIIVQTQAPDVAHAIKLANAAVAGLSAYLDTKATDETVPDTHRLKVRALGTAQGQVVSRGPGRTMAVVGAIFAFLAGCGLILAVSALVKGWRAAVVSEQDGGELEAIYAEEADDQQQVWPVGQRSEATKLRAW